MHHALLHTTWAPVNTSGQCRKRDQRCRGKLYGSNGCAVKNAASDTATRCDDLQADVVIVGGGIIGLCAAYSLLKHTSSNLSVAIIETNKTIPGPAVGNGSATGAGQGYLWMAHRNPDSPAWRLAKWSKALWQELLRDDEYLLEDSVEWQRSGSILLATSLAEAEQLQQREAMLGAAGVDAVMMSTEELRAEEPALGSAVCAGLLTRSDVQLNGRMAAAALLEACRSHSDGSRLNILLEHSVDSFELCQDRGRVLAVQTDKRRILPGRAVVLAAGAWTGALAAKAAPNSSAAWLASIQPRRGHLLELGPGCTAPITHGLMEIGYAQHYASGTAKSGDNLDITFTATTSASGSLLLGSSREFCGFEGQPSRVVTQAILERAVKFLPALEGVDVSDAHVRVGLRPYSSRGLPYIGQVPGSDGLFVAAGHEGSGLTYGPASGEIIRNLILGGQLEEEFSGAFGNPH